MRCGRPLLLAPRKAPTSLTAKVAIAWKDTQEAARAVSAAMPFLRKAKSVIILCVPEDKGGGGAGPSTAELVENLVWHG
jgi:hypothetical protein